MVEITALNAEAMKKMYLSFYGEEHKNSIDKLVESCHYSTLKTGAELQQLFLTYDADEVLTHLENKNG